MIEVEDLELEDFLLWEALRSEGYVDKHWQLADIRERVRLMRLAHAIAKALRPQVESRLEAILELEREELE